MFAARVWRLQTDTLPRSSRSGAAGKLDGLPPFPSGTGDSTTCAQEPRVCFKHSESGSAPGHQHDELLEEVGFGATCFPCAPFAWFPFAVPKRCARVGA